jgi:acetylornithine/succinyldiaminopimelate/putrescine aminotransferase
MAGGLARVAASLDRRLRYREEVDTLHTSTFAANSFSSAVALIAVT